MIKKIPIEKFCLYFVLTCVVIFHVFNSIVGATVLTDKKIANALAFLSFAFFLYHSSLYYIFPDLHYSKDINIIVIVRTICATALVLTALITSRQASLEYLFIFLLFSSAFLVFISPRIAQGEFISMFAVPFLPLLFFLLPLRFDWVRARPWFYTFSLINTGFIIFDFFVLNGIFEKFSYNEYYRPVGLSLNPNIAGIVASLFLYILAKENRFFLVLIVLFSIILTGSKTAYVLTLITLLCGFYNSCIKNKILIAGFALMFSLSVLTLLYLSNTGGGFFDITGKVRDFELVSLYIRLEDYKVFFNNISVFHYNLSPYSIDNGAVSKFIMGGLFFLAIWYALFFYCLCMARGEVLFFLCMLAIASFTTNIYYTWPLGYLMYFLLGDAVRKNRAKKDVVNEK